jgi:hypothetical protein
MLGTDFYCNKFILVFILQKKPKKTLILSLLNIFLLIIPLIMLYFGKYLNIEQLKNRLLFINV